MAQEPETPAKVARPQPTRAAVEGRRAELLKLLEREQTAAEQYLLQQGEMEQKRLELELTALQAQLEAARTEQELELRNLKRELQRAHEQAEVGLASPAERERIQNALAVAELRLTATEAERAARQKQVLLQIEAAGRKLAFEKRQLEIEHARRRLELGGTADLRVVRTPDSTVAADQTQPISAGDVLRVEIEGEPALPRDYRVDGRGTITLPLLGAIQAAGRTAGEVRGEIRRLLIERGLKSEPAVTVTRRQDR